MAEMAILYDTSRCTGCHACQIACKCWNNQPSPIGLNENKFSGSHQNPPEINGDTRLIMTYTEEANENLDPSVLLGTKRVKWAFGRRACQHCTDAGCVSICPAGAIYKDEETGMVTHDQDKCIGCQYCHSACPFDVPRYYNDGLRTVINKCSGCVDRVKHGMAPACVTTCQPEALEFGDRLEMMSKAHERVAMLKERGYNDACVYGETEMGGLHVIQVLKYGKKLHGAPEDPKVMGTVGAMNVLKPITAVVAPVVVVGLGAMFAMATGYKRDTLTYNPETKDTLSVNTGKVIKHGDGLDERDFVEAVTENLPFMEANKKNKEGK